MATLRLANWDVTVFRPRPRCLTDEVDDDGDLEVGGELGHLGLLHHPRLQVQELAGGVVSPFRPLPSLAAVATGVIWRNKMCQYFMLTNIKAFLEARISRSVLANWLADSPWVL